jgi:hypothetical protein
MLAPIRLSKATLPTPLIQASEQHCRGWYISIPYFSFQALFNYIWLNSLPFAEHIRGVSEHQHKIRTVGVLENRLALQAKYQSAAFDDAVYIAMKDISLNIYFRCQYANFFIVPLFERLGVFGSDL